MTGEPIDPGRTALAAAVLRPSTETVTRLPAAGADPDAGGPGARATAHCCALCAISEILGQDRGAG